ncbi:hypothetical protein GOBAR_DD05361 [Gossypium barbadense]|nr:hypothetical protein GOBAR_DD05361 [Gossypium barbadense]
MGWRLPFNGHKEVGLKRGPWTAEEDQILMAYIQQHGHGNWRALPEKAGDCLIILLFSHSLIFIYLYMLFDAASFPSGSNLTHMAQWESARLEAEARLVRDSKQVVPNPIHPKNHLTLNHSQLRPRCLDVLKAWQGVVAGMFAFPTQDLGSPTSTLSYTDGEMGFDDSLKCIENSNQMKEIEETITDGCIDECSNCCDSVFDLVNSSPYGLSMLYDHNVMK